MLKSIQTSLLILALAGSGEAAGDRVIAGGKAANLLS